MKEVMTSPRCRWQGRREGVGEPLIEGPKQQHGREDDTPLPVDPDVGTWTSATPNNQKKNLRNRLVKDGRIQRNTRGKKHWN